MLNLFQLSLRAFLTVFLFSLAGATKAYVLIDNLNTANITECYSNPFGQDVAIQGNQYKLLAPGVVEGFNPHNGYCERNYYYGIGGEHAYLNEASASNSGQTISLIRTNWLDQALTINLAGESSEMNFVYDGIDNDWDDDNFGLNADFFSDGDNVFRIRVSTASELAEVHIRLSEDAGNYSEFSMTLPNSENVYQYIDIPLSSFVATAGTGADFSSVKSVALDFINTAVPEGEGSPLYLNEIIPENYATLICSNDTVGSQCPELHYGLGVDLIEINKQLTVNSSAELLVDRNGDGDYDSVASPGEGDVIRYTVEIINVEDLLASSVTDLVYTASFDANATFLDNVTVSEASTVSEGESAGTVSIISGDTPGDGTVEILISELEDTERIIFSYDVQIDSDLQNVPDLQYSHYGSLNADEWAAYDLEPMVVELNEFDISASLSGTALDDSDGDSVAGPGERVSFTATVTNEGPDATSSLIFNIPSFVQAQLDAGSVTSSHGSIVSGNGQNDSAVEVSISNFPAAAVATVTFDVFVNDPFFFAQDPGISAQALLTDASEQFMALSDDPAQGGNEDITVIAVDAFPDRIDAQEDSDGDGLPENCNPACDDEDAFPNDTDNDGETNDVDADDDGDGTDDVDDHFPFDAEADTDTDGDGQPDDCVSDCGENLVLDNDDDNDGVLDEDDAFTPPLYNLADSYAASVDTDGDGDPDNLNDGENGSIECDDTCRNATVLIVDTDDDADGRPDTLDDFPKNNAAKDDEDQDGYPDAWNETCNQQCQDESGLVLDPFVQDGDNDGVPDASDAFPDDCYASIDSDGDGQPDSLHDPINEWCDPEELGTPLVIDTDDDNDGEPDETDAFNPDEYTYAAAVAASLDADLDGYPDEWNATCDTDCRNNSGLQLDPYPDDTDNDGETNDAENDTDGDGILDVDEEEGYLYIDNNPPTVVAPADIVLNSQGDLTSVSLGQANATDIVQGQVVSISVSPDNRGPFPVGVTVVTWTAVDAEGNSSSATQTVTIQQSIDDGGLIGGPGQGKGRSGEGGSLSWMLLFLLLPISLLRHRL